MQNARFAATSHETDTPFRALLFWLAEWQSIGATVGKAICEWRWIIARHVNGCAVIIQLGQDGSADRWSRNGFAADWYEMNPKWKSHSLGKRHQTIRHGADDCCADGVAIHADAAAEPITEGQMFQNRTISLLLFIFLITTLLRRQVPIRSGQRNDKIRYRPPPGTVLRIHSGEAGVFSSAPYFMSATGSDQYRLRFHWDLGPDWPTNCKREKKTTRSMQRWQHRPPDGVGKQQLRTRSAVVRSYSLKYNRLSQ